MMYTEVQLAEMALARAKRKAEMDDKVLPCRVCGHKPRRFLVEGDESMHRGWAVVECARDSIRVEKRPSNGWAGSNEEKAAFDTWNRMMRE